MINEIALKNRTRLRFETTRIEPYLVCLTAALFFSYELIQMHMFSAINQDVMREFSLNARQLGILSSVYLLANVIFLFPAGLIVDRVSTKKLILTALAICVMGTFIFASVTSFWSALLSRFTTGIGSAFCLLSCVKLATRWFPTNRMALVTGLIITIAMFGGVFAQTPLTQLTEAIGWRNALLFNGALGLLVMFAIFLVVIDYPSNSDDIRAEEKEKLSALGFITSMKLAYFNRQNWLAAIFTSTMNMPIMLLGAIWGTLYLTQVYHLSKLDASMVNTMIFIGTIIGGPTVGWISDKFENRRIPMMIGSILTLVTISLLMNSSAWGFGSLALIFFGLGFFSSVQVISYQLVAESNSIIITAACLSVISIITQGGGALYQPYFGTILEKTWNGTMIDGIPIYSLLDYNNALMMLVYGFVIALVAVFFLKESGGERS